MKKSDSKVWEIEHQCPQCGAPITLEETDRLFSCSYCRTRLYLLSQDYFKYYLPSTISPSNEMIYVPYWRFKGIVFFCKVDEIAYGVKDVTYLATQHRFLPFSLGFRPQTLKLRFVSPQMEGRFFNPQVSIQAVIESVGRQSPSSSASPLEGSVFHKAFIGDTASLIYSPIFIQGDTFYDAILGEPVGSIPKDFVGDLFTYNQQELQPIKFVSSLCPHCGWDLLGERDSVVLLCKNCDSTWEASETSLRPLDFGVMASEDGPGYYLPFWRMKTRTEGLTIQSYADLLRIANVPKAIKKEWQESDLYFWAPAFKVPPGPFLRLTRGLTLSVPQEEFEQTLPKSIYCPVTLPIREAVESIKVTLADLVNDKKNILPKLSEVNIRLDNYVLVYLPFHLRGNEFIHAQTQCCVHKNYLKLGRNF